MVMIADHPPTATTTAVKLFRLQIGISAVAQPSTEENEVAGGYSSYPDDFKQDAALALAICSLKHTTLDEKTIVELARLKQQHSIRSSGRGRGGGGGGGGGITKPPSSSPSSQSRRRPRSSRIRAEKVLKLPKVQPSQTILDQVRSYVLPTQMPAIPGLTGEMIGRRSKPFVKQLTMSDLKDDQSKLSLSKEDVKECISPMLKKTENPMSESGVDVTIYDLSGKSFKMAYKIWADGKTPVLTSGWKDFYKHHGLQKLQDFVTVWNFRRADPGKLCFLLTWRRLPCCVNVPIGRKLLRG